MRFFLFFVVLLFVCFCFVFVGLERASVSHYRINKTRPKISKTASVLN